MYSIIAELVYQLLVYPVQVADVLHHLLRLDVQPRESLLLSRHLHVERLSVLPFVHAAISHHLFNLLHAESVRCIVLLPHFFNKVLQIMNLSANSVILSVHILKGSQLLSQQVLVVLELPQLGIVSFSDIVAFATTLEGFHEVDGCLVGVIRLFTGHNDNLNYWESKFTLEIRMSQPTENDRNSPFSIRIPDKQHCFAQNFVFDQPVVRAKLD